MSDVLGELERMIAGMTPADKLALDKIILPELQTAWLPQPGPQTAAYDSSVDLLLYGGAAGGGKTDLLIGLAFTRHQRSVIFRAQYVDLRGVEERSQEILGGRDGYNGADMVWRRDGRLVEFGAIAKPDAEKSWQGRPHDFIGFDEGAQLSAAKVQFVMGWLRSATPGQRCRVVIASNPPISGEGDWLLEWFAPWLDPLFKNPARPGEKRWAVMGADGKTIWVDGPEPILIDGELITPLSRTFIPASLDDNVYLRDTGYRSQLQSLPEPLRSKLLKGDFLAGREDHGWQVIPTEWVGAAQGRWAKGKPDHVPMTTLGVDVAQGGPDNTVLAPLYSTWFDQLKVHKGVDTTDGPAVAGLVVSAMRDNCQVNIDLTGGWGISARDQLVSNNIRCAGIVFSAKSNKRTADSKFAFFNMRSELWWSFREALDPFKGDGVALPPSAALKAQLTAPHWQLRGDKILIESKDDLRKRLGTSTDEADAVIMGWHGRAEQMFWREHVMGKGSMLMAADYDPLGNY